MYAPISQRRKMYPQIRFRSLPTLTPSAHTVFISIVIITYLRTNRGGTLIMRFIIHPDQLFHIRNL